MRLTILRSVCISVVVLLCAAVSRADDDWQYWNRNHLILLQEDKTSLSILTENRMRDDMRRLGLYFFSPRVKYAVSDHLDLQLNLTYLQVRSSSRKDFGFQYRIEPEINPHFDIGDWMKVQFRNRAEFRWIEGRGSYNTRYRGRARLVFPLEGFGPVKSVFADTEYFYDIAEHQHNEQRTIPVGVNLRVSEHVGLQVFHMVQAVKGSDDWHSSQGVGTMLTIKF